jgi:hypothetical protein
MATLIAEHFSHRNKVTSSGFVGKNTWCGFFLLGLPLSLQPSNDIGGEGETSSTITELAPEILMLQVLSDFESVQVEATLTGSLHSHYKKR